MLRLELQTASLTRTLTFSTQVTQSGAASSTVGPLQLRTVVSATLSPAGRGGAIRVPYSYGAFQLLDTSVGTPQQLDAVRSALAQFQGLGGEYTMSTTGAVLSNRLDIPPTANSTVRTLLQQLSSQAAQLSVPLPTQAVGIGARWRATTQATASGIHVQQTYEYTLRSRVGGVLTLHVAYIQTAPRQRVAASGSTAGVAVDLTGYHIVGSGTTVLDLSQVIPLNGHLAAQGVQNFRVRQGGQSGMLEQQVQFGVDVNAG